MKISLWLFAAVLCASTFASRIPARGWTESSKATNLALLVGVDKGLPGIDLDIENVKRMSAHPDYKFSSTTLFNETGNVDSVVENLSEMASKVDNDGTLLFYFSGHGGKGTLVMQDRTMKIEELRSAIERGRQKSAPLKRLLLFFDSCYSGSLVPEFRNLFEFKLLPIQSLQNEVDSIVEALEPRNREETYFDKLFVFASSRANETSQAGAEGSIFTVAMGQAFDEAMEKNNTVGEFIKKTEELTEQYHHPVARVQPSNLTNEKMRN